MLKAPIFPIADLFKNLAVFKYFNKTWFFKQKKNKTFRQKRSYNNKLEHETDCCELTLWILWKTLLQNHF